MPNYSHIGIWWGSKADGGGNFYPLMKDNSIIIIPKDRIESYLKGSYVAIHDGFTVIAIAKTTEDVIRVTQRPELEDVFDAFANANREEDTGYLPSFSNDIFIADALFYELKQNERFEYHVVAGNGHINQDDVINSMNKLIKKYITPME